MLYTVNHVILIHNTFLYITHELCTYKLIYAIFMPTEPELHCVGMWSLSGKDGYIVSDHSGRRH